MSAEVRLEPRNPDSAVPLSGLQREFWRNFEKTKYSERMCHGEVRLHRAADPTLLQESLNILIQRHEVLRTRYTLVDCVPQAQIDSASDAALEVSDLEGHQGHADEEVLQIAEQFLLQKIDLSVGPLFSAKLLRLPNHEGVLLLASDHIISDGASTSILCAELCTIYQQLCGHSVVSLPKPLLQFADLAIWQARAQEQWLNEHQAYWKRYLLGAPSTRLPTDRATGNLPNIGAKILPVPFGHPLSTAFRASARSAQTLPSLVALTIYVALMSRWCGLDELILYVVTHNRCRPELRLMVGPIVGFTPLRIRVRNDDTLLDLIARVRSEFHAVCKHQSFDVCPPGCDSVETDLLFRWLPDAGKLQLPNHARPDDLEIRVQPFDFWSSRYEDLKLTMFFSETSAGVVATIVYRDNRFSAETIEQLRQWLLLFSEQLVRDPRSRILNLPRL